MHRGSQHGDTRTCGYHWRNRYFAGQDRQSRGKVVRNEEILWQKRGKDCSIRDLKSLKNFYKKSNEKKVYFCTFDLEVLIYMTLGWTLYGTNYV